MTVFVSYARADEPQAERVADTLRADGYEVWRDADLPAHQPYADVIEQRLRDAKAVVVLWSPDAAASQWVRAEADFARSAATLVQAKSMMPSPFIAAFWLPRRSDLPTAFWRVNSALSARKTSRVAAA